MKRPDRQNPAALQGPGAAAGNAPDSKQPPDYELLSARLQDEVDQLEARCHYQQAIVGMGVIRKLVAEHVGEESEAFARCLNDLAGLHRASGEYQAAEPLLWQAREIRRRVLGENHVDVAQSLNNIAGLYMAMGRFPNAEAMYRQAGDIWQDTVGKNHPDYATSRNNLGMLYLATGRYEKAEPLLQHALALRRALLGEDHPDYAQSLNNLAGLYESLGRYADAEALYRQAMELRRDNLGETHPKFAISLNNLAGLYRDRGNLAAAAVLYQQAREILRAAVGETHPYYAQCLNNLASLRQAEGDYGVAEALYREALTIRREVLGEAHPDLAASLNELAGLKRATGDLDAAEKLYLQALDIRQAVFGLDHPDYAQSLNNLAGLWQARGKYRVAERLYLQAAEIWREQLGENHPEYATALNNLGMLYRAMGNYKAAAPYYQQALEIRRNILGERHPHFAQSLNNLAGLYESMGQDGAAEQLYRQAMEIRREILGERHPHYAISLNNLAGTCRALGRLRDAEVLYLQALEVFRMVLGEQHPYFAQCLHNLAELYGATGDQAAAETLFQQALTLRQAALGERHPDLAATLNNLGSLLRDLGKHQQAEVHLQAALEIRQAILGNRHPAVAQSLSHLARLCVATGRTDQALVLASQAAAIHDGMLSQVFTIGSESQRMAFLRTLQADFDLFLSLVCAGTASPPAMAAGFDLLLRRKALGAEALAAQRDAILGGRYPQLQARLQELTALRRQIVQKTLAGPGPQDQSIYAQRLADWHQRRETLEAELARRIPEMNLERILQTADCRSVAIALPAGATLVEFVRFHRWDLRSETGPGPQPAHYLAFVLPAGQPERLSLIDLGDAGPIERLVANLRDAISGGAEQVSHRGLGQFPLGSPGPVAAPPGMALRAAVFDPLLPALGAGERLLLAPGGALARVPFEVLPLENGSHLIDRYRISYVGTGRDVLRFGVPAGNDPAESLVVAAPDFDLQAPAAPEPAQPAILPQLAVLMQDEDLQFPLLPGTRVEGESIAARLQVQPWLHEDALEARLKSCRSPRVLHLATHGFCLPNQAPAGGAGLENPLLRSGLALAGANTWLKGGALPAAAEDGILTAEDVSGLDLLATELVVLSACDTGLGEVHDSEGVLGLRRSFVVAGARTLVMSLWKVPDEQTRELMEDFYQRVLTGRARADALREAQLALKERHPHPFVWGGFICEGDPGPLATRAEKL